MTPVTLMSCSSRWHVKARPLFKTAHAVLLCVAVCLTVFLCGSARADTSEAGPQLPGSRLQGEATMRFWGMRVYTARLWALPDFHAERASEEPVMLELQYLMDLKGKAIAERSLQEMRRAENFPQAQAARWLTLMQDLFPDVKSGDRLTGVHEPGQGVRFWFNGKPLGRVEDPVFARLFFGIWLAPTTSDPDMRLTLLGRKP